MLRILILHILLNTWIFSLPLTLEMILEQSQHSPLKKAIREESLSKQAHNRAETTTDPLTLYGNYAKATPYDGLRENEYSVGISQNLSLGSIRTQEKEILALQRAAEDLEAQKILLTFSNEIKNLYHQHCIDQISYRTMQKSYQSIEKLYHKKETSFALKEISKIELMQLQLEKEQRYTMLKGANNIQENSKNYLLKLSGIPQTHTSLSCQDLYPIHAQIHTEKTQFQLTQEAYQKRLQSTQNTLSRYNTPLESMTISAQYDKELDIKRYTVGVSIPLTFTSKRSEEKRLEALHASSAIHHRHDQKMREKSAMLTRLNSTLKNQANTIQTLRKTLHTYTNELLPLMEKGYLYGESTLTDYLLNQQRYYALYQHHYESQKAYYHTLFALYSLTEQKDH